MSNLRKIRKNANNFNIKELYSNMTPEQYREGIKNAVTNAVREVGAEYEKTVLKLKKEYENNIKYSTIYAIDTLSVELLYELAKQMGCFEEDPEYLEQKIDKVKDIYENTMDSIKKYADMKNDKQAHRKFLKRKKVVEKMFDIKFEE